MLLLQLRGCLLLIGAVALVALLADVAVVIAATVVLLFWLSRSPCFLKLPHSLSAAKLHGIIVIPSDLRW